MMVKHVSSKMGKWDHYIGITFNPGPGTQFHPKVINDELRGEKKIPFQQN